jgi:oligopeptidase B
MAEKRAHVHREHGQERVDPWYWLRDREDPATIAYIEAENAYMEGRTAHTQAARDQLFAEMLGRIQETDTSAPVARGGWLYYSRTVEGLSYPIYCRKKGSMDAEEQVLLDVNVLGEAHEFVSLGVFTVSPDHRTVAYAVDTTGRELYRLVFLDIESGRLHEDVIEGISPSVTWANDSRTVWYSTRDEAMRPHRVVRHTVGTPVSEDRILFQEDDEVFRVGHARTRDHAFLTLYVVSSTTTEIWVVDADTPDADLRCLQPRHPGMRYQVDHRGDQFFVVTDDCDDADGNHIQDRVNNRLMVVPDISESRADWVELIGYRAEVELVSAELFRDHLVVVEREDGLIHFRIRDLRSGEEHRIQQPESAYDAGFGFNPNFDTAELRYGYSSMVTPSTVFLYDMNTRVRSTLKVTPVLGGYTPDNYATERTYATSADGVKVPISLVYRRDLKRDGARPVLLYGYGSYGLTIDAGFSSFRLSLLERGVVFAIAHVRGGGYLGRQWYEDAKFLHKARTFTDFIVAAEHLISEGWTSPQHLAIQGGSAGGLLIGSVINMRPDLFTAAVAQVPFVDVVTTMLDEALPLTAGEWEEWGDPREPEFFACMRAYSPYDNVVDQTYPDLLVTSGLNDPRVQYWEPTKWVAKLRDVAGTDTDLILKTHMGAGHQGKSGRYGYIEDRAFTTAFVLDKLGCLDGG